jgi:hypothetical protein
MKTPSTTLIALWSSLALVLAAAIWLPAQSPAAEPENVKPMTEEKMKGCCGTMKTQMGKMKTDVKAQDDELTEQVAKMHMAMRQHIMQHMSMSKESIAGCSMMKGTDEKSTDAEKTPK